MREEDDVERSAPGATERNRVSTQGARGRETGRGAPRWRYLRCEVVGVLERVGWGGRGRARSAGRRGYVGWGLGRERGGQGWATLREGVR